MKPGRYAHWLVAGCFLFGTAALAAVAEDLLRERAQDIKPVLDGEAFDKVFVAANATTTIVEFVRDGESFENWTRLVAFRSQQVPGIDNDPERLALAMMERLREANPDAQFNVERHETSGSILLDFMTWPLDESYLELNVFRFQQAPAGDAIVSFQLSARMPPLTTAGREVLERVSMMRDDWIRQAAGFDMQPAFALFE